MSSRSAVLTLALVVATGCSKQDDRTGSAGATNPNAAAAPASGALPEPDPGSASRPRSLPAQAQAPQAPTRPESKPGIGGAEQHAAPSAAKANPTGMRDRICGEGKRYFAHSELDEAELVERLVDQPAGAFRSVGDTSVVFKVVLTRSLNAAFKLSSKRRPHAAEAEIAAYRLARCLGLTNVPPAVGRSWPTKQVRRKLSPTGTWSKIAEQLPGRDAALQGALIYWVPALRDIGIDKAAGIQQWSKWLRLDGALPEEKRRLARAISNMLVFDYLVANWDRFSGANASARAGKYLVMRDHDVAFPARLPTKVHRRLLRRLLRAQRFSRRTLQHLRQLTPAMLQAELMRDPILAATGGWLQGERIQGLWDRRDAVLSHVASLAELHGETKVLAFD